MESFYQTNCASFEDWLELVAAADALAGTGFSGNPRSMVVDVDFDVFAPDRHTVSAERHRLVFHMFLHSAVCWHAW